MELSFKNMAVGQKIISGFILIIILTAILGGISYFTINKLVKESLPVMEANDALVADVLELRMNEKDFLLREKTNPEFFTTGKSTYLDNFEAKYQDALENVKIVKEYEAKTGDTESIQRLNDVEAALKVYQTGFMK